MKTFEDGIDEILGELRKTLISKQHDYGHLNITEFGEYGVLVRANDKMARLKNLSKSGEPKNESISDTWIDLAGYSVIALMVRNGTFELPLKGVE